MTSQNKSLDRLPLVLGTAQLGLPYGVANARGMMTAQESAQFLDHAWWLGYRLLDTAQGYGESEARIGAFTSARSDRRFGVVTKIPPQTNLASAAAVEEAIQLSVRRLGRPLWGMLLHHGEMLKAWEGPLGQKLEERLADGSIENLGVSIYTPAELEHALKIPSLRLIQIPFHVFDQEIEASGLLDELRKSGRRLFVRSLFLQGLLLMSRDAAIAKVPDAEPYLNRWWSIVEESGRSAASVAFHFVRQALPQADLIVGCESIEQLEANAKLAREPELEQQIFSRLLEFGPVAEHVRSPRFWR